MRCGAVVNSYDDILAERSARKLCRGGHSAILANLPDMQDDSNTPQPPSATEAGAGAAASAPAAARESQPTPREIGGPAGPEPTRFGDWERKGRCIDF